ncbi:MAG TPA: hypothetical protein VFX51_12590 [Solirubrobacteraceae bacterium]|nr:hypothetical protein [Solirubrobacteraceae bacterium]
MADFEAPNRAVYDHDNEEPRPAGRRRRQVADWGVGEEIFDHMPGRRFERRPHQEIPRGDAEDGRRTIVIETGDEELPATTSRPAADEEFASRDEAIRARQADDELWGGDEPFAPRAEPAAWSADDEPFARRAEPARADDDETEFVAASGGQHDTGEFAPVEPVDEPGAQPPGHTGGIVRGGVEGRRTVKIGGRPAEFHGPPARARQRPPRAMHERLGPRPDRVAMWAFALGILLILIAIATANA